MLLLVKVVKLKRVSNILILLINGKLGVRLQRTVIMKESKIKAHSWVSDSIIGAQCTIGKWV